MGSERVILWGKGKRVQRRSGGFGTYKEKRRKGGNSDKVTKKTKEETGQSATSKGGRGANGPVGIGKKKKIRIRGGGPW